jgi:hypothetical protein
MTSSANFIEAIRNRSLLQLLKLECQFPIQDRKSAENALNDARKSYAAISDFAENARKVSDDKASGYIIHATNHYMVIVNTFATLGLSLNTKLPDSFY